MSADKRLWAKIDLGYFANPKMADVLDASSNAVCMHLASILHCAQHLTDGHVSPKTIQRTIGGTDEDTQLLIENGLWHEPGHDCPDCPDAEQGRVYVHDYTYHNVTSDKVKQKSKKASKAANIRWENERKRKAAEQKQPQATDAPRMQDACTAHAPRMQNAMQDAMPNAMLDREIDKIDVNPPTPPKGGDGWGDDQQQLVEVDQSAPPAPKRKTKPAANAHNTDPEFAKFWDVYPLKKSKKAAYSAYRKALEIVDQETLIAGAASYRDDPSRNPDKTKHPSTWLNQHCWEDEPGPAAPPANWIPNQHPAMSAADRRLLEAQQREQRILAGEFQHLTSNQPYAPLRAVEGERYG